MNFINFVLQAVPFRVALLAFLWMSVLTPVSAQDLANLAILAPNTGCALGSAEPVTMRIFNYGPTRPSGSQFVVAYSIAGQGGTVNEQITLGQDFQANSSLIFTFMVGADLSVPGSYTFTVSISPSGDINPNNNTISNYTITNVAPTVAGSLTGPSSGNNGTLSLIGATGNVVQWEESPDNLRWFKLANTASTQNFSGLTSATRFRARVANAPCPAATSNVLTVTP